LLLTGYEVIRAGPTGRSRLIALSSKAVHETTTKVAVRWGRASPDPQGGVAIELGRGETGGVGDVGGISQRDAREGCATEDTPPALDQVQPGGASRDEGVLDPRMVCQPLPNGALKWLAKLSAIR
jgi:hypothetical protein